jgi:hypothetical protein
MIRPGVLADFLVKYTPRCEEVTRLHSESLDHPIPWRKRIGVKFHFLICVWCEQYLKQLRFIRRAVRTHPERLEGQDMPSSPSLSPEAKERMKRTLRGE